MPTPSTPEEAIYARLAADAPLSALAAGRISPTTSEQEEPLPFVVYQRTGKDSQKKLDGSPVLARYLVRVDCYAADEAEAQAVGNAVQDSLCPDGGWQDLAAGVQGVFDDDASMEEAPDGVRVWSGTFGVWWKRPA